MSKFNDGNQENLNTDDLNIDNRSELSSQNGNEVQESEIMTSEIEIKDNTEYDEEDTSKENTTKKNKESLKEKIKKSFTSRKFIGGAYATVISAVVIIVVILVNVIITKLDLKVDVSQNRLYTISDVTKDYVKNIEDDITLYYIAQTGNENATFTEIVEKYPQLSSKIKVEYKDPVLYPTFTSQYVEENVSENSIIVVNNSNGRVKYIASTDMVESSYDYYSNSSHATGIDVEGQITSALQYVTTEDLPVMYMVEGHGESTLSSRITDALDKVNVTTNTLSTLTADSIPEDCSILLINGPTTDFTENEIAMLEEYLKNGGKALIFVDYRANGLTNFNELLDYYGVELVEGFTIEGNASYYIPQLPNYLVPEIKYHDVTSGLQTGKKPVLLPMASGIKTLDSARSTIEVTSLLTTSDSAYSRVNLNSANVEKEEGDIEGPFDLGVAITENYNDIETKLVVFGSTGMIVDEILSTSSYNLNLLTNSINYLAGEMETLAVPSKSVETTYLSLTASQVRFLAPVVVIVIPVVILGIGGFICIKRRKK